ncbi:hypothetical protein PFFVO_05992 [Plasmodium falciparum Vietnam Oak-Knoll (FVO)]|uniref:Uncharacterized protein n=1 Tax=Plasmodium falciparum Vietnam Oak-Knoll (FVO) TaxID=1036723 RepID=A0A024UYL9_PLAFA|nr:hypothetical protein PFFVO_05992 [Plasmodium falciparum Vietnam Oak-Knoll (FVO)]
MEKVLQIFVIRKNIHVKKRVKNTNRMLKKNMKNLRDKLIDLFKKQEIKIQIKNIVDMNINQIFNLSRGMII